MSAWRAGVRSLWVGLGALTAPLAAQRPDSLPAFNGLRTPVSPAFVLLGVAPTVVERPNTPSDLAVTALTQTQGLTAVPRDLALELSPYWLFGHPRLTWQDDTIRSPLASLARTATVSLATAEIGTTAAPATGLAIGLRGAPFSGRLSAATIGRLQQLDSMLADESRILAGLGRARRDAIKAAAAAELAAARNADDSAAATKRETDRRRELTLELMGSPEYEAVVRQTEEEIEDFAVVREGFLLKVAGGVVWSAPGAVADSAQLTRVGAWITASYQSNRWSFVLVNRFLVGGPDSTFDALDLGLRLLHTARKYALSVEGAFRAFTEGSAPENQYRITGGFDYELGKGLWLNTSFGRGFDSGAEQSFIVQFGLSLNVAGQRVAFKP